MNVDEAFILPEICRNQEDLIACLLTTACRYFSAISHYERKMFGKMFVTRITLSHAFKKIFIKMSK